MQRKNRIALVGTSVWAASVLFAQTAMADAITEALTGGKAYGDFRLRYEAVDQDNSLKDASGLTLRSRLGYQTGEVAGFSATMEFEDSRVVAGVDDFNDTVTSSTSRQQYAVIADPETTELDQAFVQYKGHGVTAKLGRQVVTYDNQRFVGHVGWRQDRQTFDGITFEYAGINNLTIDYAYLEQRNRIFGDDKDIDSNDHLLNVAYKTTLGTLTGYSYLLEEDTSTELAFDTYGVRFTGASGGDVKFLYTAEYASQKKRAKNTKDQQANYLLLEGGVSFNGITAKLGYEMLGSDNGEFGFSTPLATGHAFNGWADQFLATPNEGLVDLYASVSAGIGPGKLTVVYHDYSADDDNATSDNFGDELNVVYGMKFGKHYNAGIKYAAYSAKDPANSGAKSFVDTDKFWLWVGASF